MSHDELGVWRRDRDSNPGDGFPPTHFPGVRLRPLGHLSMSAILGPSKRDLQGQNKVELCFVAVVGFHISLV